MEVDINITVSIEQADLKILQDLDSAIRTSDPDMTQTNLNAKLGEDTVIRLRSMGFLDWEYMEFQGDIVYWISNLGQLTMSAAIQSGILPESDI